eukprot:CAMPEP_0184504150 /NCGR_PEP_ID=MMETSP0113_2-20130426/52309_1 /TAXON_ID=91329 /ORGANISM="Norrisiella sphaerica, Strain BC52" /LENGTH=1028 /DNA_ID=CAMNT_0026893769 /DNA_START=540 /DNA_END=3627 /DNA_ORIENTATION=-
MALEGDNNNFVRAADMPSSSSKSEIIQEVYQAQFRLATISDDTNSPRLCQTEECRQNLSTGPGQSTKGRASLYHTERMAFWSKKGRRAHRKGFRQVSVTAREGLKVGNELLVDIGALASEVLYPKLVYIGKPGAKYIPKPESKETAMTTLENFVLSNKGSASKELRGLFLSELGQNQKPAESGENAAAAAAEKADSVEVGERQEAREKAGTERQQKREKAVTETTEPGGSPEEASLEASLGPDGDNLEDPPKEVEGPKKTEDIAATVETQVANPDGERPFGGIPSLKEFSLFLDFKTERDKASPAETGSRLATQPTASQPGASEETPATPNYSSSGGQSISTAAGRELNESYTSKLDRVAAEISNSSYQKIQESLFNSGYYTPTKDKWRQVPVPQYEVEAAENMMQLKKSPDTLVIDSHTDELAIPQLPDTIECLGRPGHLSLTRNSSHLKTQNPEDVIRKGLYVESEDFFPPKKVDIPEQYENIVLPKDMHSQYITDFTPSSRDKALEELARKHNCQVMASTSSIGNLLIHLHFAFCGKYPAGIKHFSPIFQALPGRFTRTLRSSTQVIMRNRGDGLWGLDSTPATSEGNVLMELGKSFEQMLVSNEDEWRGMLKATEGAPYTDTPDDVFRYTKFQALMLRSQLDTAKFEVEEEADKEEQISNDDTTQQNKRKVKVFDIKTRAINPIRMDVKNYELFDQFRVKSLLGAFKSFEREWYDMVRSTFLKYNFQCRIGSMDGVIIAFHNTRSVLGYQYVPLSLIDYFLYGNSEIAEQMFSTGIQSLDNILPQIATEFKDQEAILVTFETEDLNCVNIFVEAFPADRKQRILGIKEQQARNRQKHESYKMFDKMAETPHWTEVDRMSEETLKLELEKRDLPVEAAIKDQKATLEAYLISEFNAYPLPLEYYEDLERVGLLKRYQFLLATYQNGKLVEDPLKLTCKRDHLETYIKFSDHELAAAKLYHLKIVKRSEADSREGLQVSKITLEEGVSSEPPKVEGKTDAAKLRSRSQRLRRKREASFKEFVYKHM